MDLHREEALYHQDIQPPDTQLAAGPTNLAEADNDTLSIWSKSGALLASSDLNAFFDVAAGYDFSDPRLLYDAESSRWFLTGLSFDSLNDSVDYIAVSETSDPRGTWDKFVLARATAVLGDQPMVGVDADKVVVSWDDFSGSPPSTPTFTGQETHVLQKSDLLSGVAAHDAVFGPDTMRFRIVPALTLTPGTTTEWLTYNEAACTAGCSATVSALGVVAITGTPLAGNVAWTEGDPKFTATNAPPPPRQPSGVPVTTQIEDHFISAVWRGGHMWIAGNDACMPAGDSAMRSCLRLVEVVTGSSPAVIQDFDASARGIDLYFPAVMVDPAGDIFVSYTKSSPGIYPTAAAVDGPVGSPATLGNEIVLAAGRASYLAPPNNRWGDYSAAAPDPSNPSQIWVTAEYQADTIDATDWGTATAEVTIYIRPSTNQSVASSPQPRGSVTQSSPAPASPRTHP